VAGRHFLAFDLGASSGRAMLGRFEDGWLSLEEVHRFPNGPVRILDSLHWDLLRLFDEMKTGLGLVGRRNDVELAGVAVDTWGVDFGLLARDGTLLGNPYHYMDRRTAGIMPRVFERMPREEIFEITGLQFLELNTLFQLYAMVEASHPWLQVAETLLSMPNLFLYLLSGAKVAEYTHASTTQLLDARTRQWADPIFERLNLPRKIMPEIVPPSTVVGELLPWIAEETNLGRVPVIATATHDTASAVAAVPADPRTRWCYISSGTWALMGVETPSPMLTAKVAAHNFTNEGGVGGTIRLLKNIMGLMLLQGCRRTWTRQGNDLSYEQMCTLAEQARPFSAILNPDDPVFWELGDTPQQVRTFCQQTGQTPPQTRGEMVRAILEGLALRCRQTLDLLEDILEQRLEVIHIVGGGSKNRLLCQFTADATGRPVVAGPDEATAIGNLLGQALATGLIASVAEGREIVRRSYQPTTYEPHPSPAWDEAFERFCALVRQEG